jgi:hypothetical protein
MSDVWMVADLLGLVGDVERVDTDIVAAYQVRSEVQEIPPGAGSR